MIKDWPQGGLFKLITNIKINWQNFLISDNKFELFYIIVLSAMFDSTFSFYITYYLCFCSF
jgi:hypothetical protein